MSSTIKDIKDPVENNSDIIKLAFWRHRVGSEQCTACWKMIGYVKKNICKGDRKCCALRVKISNTMASITGKITFEQ